MKSIIFKFLFFFLVIISVALHARSIEYTLTIENPEQHLAEIEMQIPSTGLENITVALPAWAPGRYVIYNFSKNLFDLQATNNAGQTLHTELLDKQTWRISCSGSDTIKIKYQIFANTLDGTQSKIDSSGASINGAGVFLYQTDAKHLPVQLKVLAPDGWKIVSPMQETKGIFHADNYDRLVDSPIEMGNLVVYSFQHLGKEHDLVFHRQLKVAKVNLFIQDLKKVITQLANIFDGKLPYKRYVFFFHLDAEHPNGMEHLNSCQVLRRMNLDEMELNANTDPDYDNLIWLSAHEFFHVWNIKRIRPAGLGPFDYSKEAYTKSLWVVEGLTSYFGYLSLIRSGIYTREYILSEFSGRINRYENDPGKKHRSLEEVSMLTWLFRGHVPIYEATNVHETTYSYYYKGIIVGLLLDLKIRSESGNQKSLDDVMRAMYAKYYLGSEGDYYLPGKGYTEQNFEDMAEKVSGLELDNFFDAALRSTDVLDYGLLQEAGLSLRKKANGKWQLETLPTINESQQAILNNWLRN